MKWLNFFLIFSIAFVGYGYAQFSLEHYLTITSPGEVIVYLNGFRADNKPAAYKTDITTWLRNGENRAVLVTSDPVTVSIDRYGEDGEIRSIFSMTYAKNDPEESKDDCFQIEDFPYIWSWESAEQVDTLTPKDMTSIQQIIDERISAFKDDTLNATFTGSARYYIQDLATASKRSVAAKIKSILFFYDKFLSPEQRKEWVDISGEVVIEKSPYNDQIVIAYRKNGKPLFSVRSAMNDYYEESYMYFMKKDGQWYLLS